MPQYFRLWLLAFTKPDTISAAAHHPDSATLCNMAGICDMVVANHLQMLDLFG